MTHFFLWAFRLDFSWNNAAATPSISLPWCEQPSVLPALSSPAMCIGWSTSVWEGLYRMWPRLGNLLLPLWSLVSLQGSGHKVCEMQHGDPSQLASLILTRSFIRKCPNSKCPSSIIKIALVPPTSLWHPLSFTGITHSAAYLQGI